MDTNSLDKKIDLIQWFSSIEDAQLLDKLIQFRKEQNPDGWNSISKEEKMSIQKGMEDAEKGKLIDHSQAKTIYEKWL